MGTPYLSIITPSYQQGDYLGQTLASILDEQGQTEDFPYELIVMDGGSTDQSTTHLTARDADPRLSWQSQPDNGQSDAINQGLAKAQGEVFNWINSDDLLVPGAVETVVRRFRLDPDLRILCGKCAKFDDATGEVTGLLQMETKRELEATMLIGRCCQPGTFWRTALVRELGGVRTDLRCVMDWHLWLKYLVHYGLEGVAFEESTLAQFREHPAAKSSAEGERFRDEANAVWLDLFTFLNAPTELLAFLETLTPVRLPPTDWQPGPHLRPARLFHTLCARWAHKFRKSGKKEEARFLIDQAWRAEKRPTPLYLNSRWKLRGVSPWTPQA